MFEKGVILKPWSLMLAVFLISFYSFPEVLDVVVAFFFSMFGAVVIIGASTYYYFAFWGPLPKVPHEGNLLPLSLR